MPGVTEPVKVVVFTNKGREKNEKAPNYVIYRSEDSAQAKEGVQKVSQVAQEAADEVVSEQTSNDENIPDDLF
jgi:hypothetical protein